MVKSDEIIGCDFQKRDPAPPRLDSNGALLCFVKPPFPVPLAGRTLLQTGIRSSEITVYFVRRRTRKFVSRTHIVLPAPFDLCSSAPWAPPAFLADAVVARH